MRTTCARHPGRMLVEGESGCSECMKAALDFMSRDALKRSRDNNFELRIKKLSKKLQVKYVGRLG